MKPEKWASSLALCFKSNFALQMLLRHCFMKFDVFPCLSLPSSVTALSFNPSILHFLPFIPYFSYLCLFDTLSLFRLLPFSIHSLPVLQLSSLIFFPSSNASSCHFPFCLDLFLHIGYRSLHTITWTFLVLSHFIKHCLAILTSSSPFLTASLSLHQQNDHFPFSLFLRTWVLAGFQTLWHQRDLAWAGNAMMVILWKSTSFANKPVESLFLSLVWKGYCII